MKYYQGLLRIQLNLGQQREAGVVTAQDDLDAVQFIMRAQQGFADDRAIDHPGADALKSMFSRQISQIARENNAESHQSLRKMNLAPNPRERLEACSYYLFQLNTQDFINKLPETVPVVKPF